MKLFSIFSAQKSMLLDWANWAQCSDIITALHTQLPHTHSHAVFTCRPPWSTANIGTFYSDGTELRKQRFSASPCPVWMVDNGCLLMRCPLNLLRFTRDSHIQQGCCQRNEAANSSWLKGSEEIIYLSAWAGEMYGPCTGPRISWLHLKSSGSATVAQKDKLLVFCSRPYLK